ncbi:right-handed parallel beta-helix repeat-containing protein [Plantactinospora sp. B6F1]|uniref:right-handed parallel beta-helix repeat-containing protein n=1 Tax=Plantactinospora sp. B6F1 TaxID=3158971 RepID=UPI0032D8DBBC
MGAAPVLAAETSGVPWVGPAGSGATYEVDDSLGAQDAINRALRAVGQGAVYVAGGTYTIKAPVILGDRQTLVGAGPLGTVLRAGSGFTGAMVSTPSGTFDGSRMCLFDIGLDGARLATNGVNLQISTKPARYGPDPAPWLGRVFVTGTTSDGIYLGGAYSGGMREYKITDCRVEKAGGWAYNLQSSDGFVSGCSAQGGVSGGYLVGGGNTKVWGCKAYGTGSGSTPGPAFRISSARATVVGCEAQDTYGCGFEVTGKGSSVSGCTADSTGVGADGTDRYSAGFFIGASAVNVEGCSYQRPGGGGSWIGANGMFWALYLNSGVDYLSVRLVSDPAKPAPFKGKIFGTVGPNSSVSVIG